MNLTRDTIQPTTGVWWELSGGAGRALAQTSSLPGHGQAGRPHPPASPGSRSAPPPHNHRQQMALNRQQQMRTIKHQGQTKCQGMRKLLMKNIIWLDRITYPKQMETFHSPLAVLNFYDKYPTSAAVSAHYSTCCSQVTQFGPLWPAHPRSEVVNLNCRSPLGGFENAAWAPPLNWSGVQPGHRDFFFLKAPRRCECMAGWEPLAWNPPRTSHLRSCNDAYWLQMAWDRFVGGCLLFVAFEWNASISLFFNSAGPHALFSLTSVGC